MSIARLTPQPNVRSTTAPSIEKKGREMHNADASSATVSRDSSPKRAASLLGTTTSAPKYSCRHGSSGERDSETESSTPVADAYSEGIVFSQREREFAFSVAMKYLKDEDEAADVTQDALLLAFRHRASFRGDSQFTTWLYRVAATAALMHLRRKRRMPKELAPREDEDSDHDDSEAIQQISAPGPSPEEALAIREAVACAWSRLVRMGEKYGDVFLLRFRDGFSELEIAEKLNLNVTTVKTRAYRARAALRAEIEGATS
ncbi:MAG: sigma-70 family RNA polymerase sigma factor [Pseudomonadota bacterium]